MRKATETPDPECWSASWCAEHGPDVRVDEDGCCVTCGNGALGPGAEQASCDRRRLAKAQRDRRALADVLSFSGPSDRAVERIHAPEDAEVRNLCERVGYGAVMDSAARQWAAKDPVGAHTTGLSRSLVFRALRAHGPRARKACARCRFPSPGQFPALACFAAVPSRTSEKHGLPAVTILARLPRLGTL